MIQENIGTESAGLCFSTTHCLLTEISNAVFFASTKMTIFLVCGVAKGQKTLKSRAN